MPCSNPLLSAHLLENRIAHTYLFSGPAGPAKTGLALEFAKAPNCDKDKVKDKVTVTFSGDSHPSGVSGACECASCGKIERRTHPDVRWFAEDELSRSIKMEEVRALLYEASLKPFEGRWKVFILEGAERLTPEAANALLKTLEEPPEHSVFLLLVENKAHLLETIQSRAFEIRGAPVAEKDPLENQKIQLLEAQGWSAYFEGLRGDSRQELQEDLETLLLYLRDGSVLEWDRRRDRSQQYLDALDSVYETQEALAAFANQKLALTHLEIRLGEILK
jgi:DNA polymerase-3 subunit delta'